MHMALTLKEECPLANLSKYKVVMIGGPQEMALNWLCSIITFKPPGPQGLPGPQ